MDSSAELRRRLLEDVCLRSVAWSRPLQSVAVHGAVLTATVSRDDSGRVECIQEDDGGRLATASRRSVDLKDFGRLPHKPLYRPSDAAQAIQDRWANVPHLDELWAAVGARRRMSATLEIALADCCPGDWTLLGAATRSAQGLATGDDRRFVGFVEGSDEARRALRRQNRIARVLRNDPEQASAWSLLKRRMGDGASLQDALLFLLELRDAGHTADLPGRKPFRVVCAGEVHQGPLTTEQRRGGIVEGPSWISYETGDRSTARGAAAWVRENPVVIDWSAAAVALLRRRRIAGPRKPVMRNEDLWFRGGRYAQSRRVVPARSAAGTGGDLQL